MYILEFLIIPENYNVSERIFYEGVIPENYNVSERPPPPPPQERNVNHVFA